MRSIPVELMREGIEGLLVMYLGDLRPDLEFDRSSVVLLGVLALPEIKASVWLNLDWPR